MMQMRWTKSPNSNSQIVQNLEKDLGVQTVVAQLLVQRGITTYEDAHRFFRPSLDDLHDPYLMKDMDKAVARIEMAVANNENIMVFGDYDVDGTTSVALMSSYLKSFYPNIATYIPDRYDEGYGISYKGIDFADDNGISLIIALDCGIKSCDHIAYANDRNIDFIICDHHRPGPELPAAMAVLDPKRDDCDYPYDELCGCGVGFKLIQALARNRDETIEDLKPYLDLVATAIAADIVPITGENRILAKFGLDVINENPRPGIKALMGSLKKNVITITDVVFVIAPRINAAGRIKHGIHAVELLSEYDFDQAQLFASEIENYNTERKSLDKEITKEALDQIVKNKEQQRFSTVVYHESWHKGVIGIVASRLTENYYRPTIVFTKSGDKLAASARSVKHFDVYNALEACAEHLEQFGGHMYAAGMTMHEHKFDDFKNAFETVVKETINPEWLIPEILIDCEINLEDITPKFLRILKQFEPFGPENMNPIFSATNIFDTGYAKTIGADSNHLRAFVKQKGSDGIGAIGFNLGKKLSTIQNRKSFEAAFCIDENEFKGETTVQLRFSDIR